MIEQAEIDGIRDDAETLLRDTGRVRVHSTTSEGGSTVDTYTPGPNLPCAIAPVGTSGSRVAIGGDRLDEASTHVVTFPAPTQVKLSDQVEVNGTIYAVTALRNFGAMSMTRRVEVRAL